MNENVVATRLYRVGEEVRQTDDDVWRSRSSLLSPEKDVLRNYGILSDVVGVGTSRVVVRIGDEVVKFARYGPWSMSNGRSQNQSEVARFDRYGNILPLLPVLNSCDSYNWVRMPYAEQLSEHYSDAQISNEVERLRLRFEGSGVNSAEIRRSNLGVYEEELWLLDYGDET